MISTPSEYKYVTGLDGIQIDGGIMPLRSGDSASSIRGEDIAFLAEAQREIINDYDGTVSPLAFDEKLMWNQAVNVLSSNAIVAYNPDASLSAGRFVEANPSSDPNRYTQDILDALGLTRVTLPTVQMQYPLIRKDDVEKNFERIQMSRRVYGGSFERTNVNWTNRNEGNGWPSGTGTSTTWNTSQFVRYVESYGSRSTTSGSTWTWTQQGRLWTAPRGIAVNHVLPADYNDVWQIWFVTAHIQKLHLSGNYDQTKTFALVAPANADWYDIAASYAVQILNSFGTWYTDTYADTDNGAVIVGGFYTKHCLATVSMNEVCRVVDVSDRIRW